MRKLEGLVHKQGQTLLDQGKKWEVVERERRLRICLTSKAGGAGLSAGESDNGKTSPGSSKGKVSEAIIPEIVKRYLERYPGKWQPSPQPQEVEPRRGAESEPGGQGKTEQGTQESPKACGTGGKRSSSSVAAPSEIGHRPEGLLN